MADYQSLLTRAVANLPSASAPAARQAIYDRARKALLTQLRTLRPPLPESDIAREESALDKAIAVVEAKFASPEQALVGEEVTQDAAASPAAPPGPPAPSPPTYQPRSRPVAPPAAPGPAQPEAAVRPTGAQPAAAGAQAARVHFTPARPSGPPDSVPQSKPAAQKSDAPAQPRPATVRQTAPAAGAQQPSAPVSGRPAPAARAPTPASPRGPVPAPPPVHVSPPANAGPNASAAAPPVVAAKADGAPQVPANLAKVVPAAPPDGAGAAVPVVVASRADNPAEVDAPEVPIDDDRIGPAARLEPEGQRPVAPMPSTDEKQRSWPWLAVAAVLVGAVLAVAVAAILMRQKPQDLAIAPPPEQHEEAPAKIAQRAQPSPAQSSPAAAPADVNPAPPATAPQSAQPPAQAGQEAQQPPAPAEAQNPNALPSSARAAMLIASADNPQKPVVNLGSTVWSTIPAAPGQPATVAVKADADIPDLKMHASMTLRKNTDPTLQATHTIDLKFTFAEGAPITGFKDVGLPQMRKLDSTASEALTSVKVKISDDYFLIALAKNDQDTARNLDLMQTRAWFDFPLLLNDNRIAKLVFQKSADGEAMLEKAFDAWK